MGDLEHCCPVAVLPVRTAWPCSGWRLARHGGRCSWWLVIEDLGRNPASHGYQNRDLGPNYGAAHLPG
jgi:hypothetical protein